MDDIRKGKPIKRTRRRKLRDLNDLDGLFQTLITINTRFKTLRMLYNIQKMILNKSR